MELLPLFPLKLVVFPGENLNLHIFEPRYKQLISEVENDGIEFGIPPYINDKLMPVGTVMELVKVEKRYPNGELDIKTKGKGLFEIHEFIPKAPDKLYSAGKIGMIKNQPAGEKELSEIIIEHIKKLYVAMEIKRPAPDNADTFQTFAVGHHVGFNLEQEYQMLTISDERKRQEFMLNHLEKLIPIVVEMEALRKKAQMNGHFKNLPPLIN